MSTKNDLIRQELTWRVGPEAADHKLQWYRWLNRAWLASALLFALLFIGGFTGTALVSLIGIAPAVAWLACITMAFLESSPRLKPGDSWLRLPKPQAAAPGLRPQHQQGRNRP